MDPSADSAFDQYRARVDEPLARLFREYGRPEWRWFDLGMVMNVFARTASLLPPLILGAAIDSVFTGDEPFALPGIPAAWLPATDAGEFWFAV